MNEIKTFAPDAHVLTPGVAMEVTNVYPANNGCMRAMPTARAISDVLPGACLGCFAFQDLSNDFRTIGGTTTGLYELTSLNWNDVSKAGGYTATKWRFAGWGNYILAVNGIDNMQVQTAAAGDFADVGGTPGPPAGAKCITASNNFVIVANITGYTNRIQWCAQGDYTDWTASVSTQAGYYDLSDTPGEITALARFRDNIVVFKERGAYLGTYVGPPYIWSFKNIETHSGTYSQESVIEHRRGIYYAGVDNFYFYDGTQPQGVGFGLRWWWINRVDRNFLANVIAVYDGKKRLMFWFYPTIDGETSSPTEAVIYDYRNDRWGRCVQTIESALVHWTPGVTYDTLSTYWSTFTILEHGDTTTDPDIAPAPDYDSPWWSAKSFGLAVIDTDHKMALYDAEPGTGQIVTGDTGNLQGYMRTLKAYPYFNVAPATCSITSRTRTQLGNAVTNGIAQSLKSDGSVDLNCTGKFTSLKLDMTGDWEIIGFETDTKPVSVF